VSYDFVDAIKLGAPEGLLSEFSRLEYKLSEPIRVKRSVTPTIYLH